ncbi:MAG TPA: nicotinate phosphoribosyltransferase [Longimicrobiales bacterium]|nr:nicotinate phosphoribosyltransferase [Longimicrobiales bacterium]
MSAPRQPTASESALLTDLYQLTMLAAYFERGMEETAVFEFFVRRLPEQRNFLVAAGLEQLVEYLQSLRFAPAELEWLDSTRLFGSEFLQRLETLRFQGDVDALPEGTAFFANEPLVRVTAPLPQAQLVETRLINLLHFQSMVASKAARCVLAADGRDLIDFGLRRAHGAEAGVLAARAAYLAGFTGTATVEAARRFGMPMFGTMAHSFVQAHLGEEAAFRHFIDCFPSHNTLLIDTYDTERAAHKVVALADRVRASGVAIQAVRIDSGDLGQQCRLVRRILDDGGLHATRIFVSGSLDEYEIERLVQSGAPVNSFGVGTHLDVSADAPYLDCAYKLQEYAGRPTRKRSEGKPTFPGRKQILRRYGERNQLLEDEIVIEGDARPGIALLEPAMRGGVRVRQLQSLAQARVRAKNTLALLPARLRSLRERGTYPVRLGASVTALAETADRLLEGVE